MTFGAVTLGAATTLDSIALDGTVDITIGAVTGSINKFNFRYHCDNRKR
jgi:hypothetical protein